MELQVCKHCRRIFNSHSGSNVCPNCGAGLDAAFKIVKRYIRSHPDASIVEVSEACEMSMEQIRQWIKEERIEYTKNSVIGIECERCGVSIRTGKLCLKCKVETVNTLKSVYVQKKEVTPDINTSGASGEKMRFLNKNNIKRDK